MNLQLSTLTQKIDEANISQSERVCLTCQMAKIYEDSGEYEKAWEVLGDRWSGPGERPLIDDLKADAGAELLMRAGVLTGFIGSAAQMAGAQEDAKNLLTESITIFERLSLEKKVAEGRIGLAVCYWREGAWDEARVLLEDVVSRLAGDDTELRGRALINSAIVEISALQFDKALRLLKTAETSIGKVESEALKGRFHHQFGLAYKKQADSLNDNDPAREQFLDRALLQYAAASMFYDKAGHKRYRARIENNTGFILLLVARFADAHEHLLRARRIFESLGDDGSIAQVDETIARVYMAEGRYPDAERAINQSVEVLAEGGERGLLVEALMTKGTVLSRAGIYGPAREAFSRAVDVARSTDDIHGAARVQLAMIEELHRVLPPTELRELYQKADETLGTATDLQTLKLIRTCAQITLAAQSEASDIEQLIFGRGCNLDEEVNKYEGRLISLALKKSEGRVTRAARILGMTHQGLGFILSGRQKHLLSERTELKPRRRSLMHTAK